ncbi:type III PLP-dependent enzyme domain-containing protein [Rathayibacter soli]|uniref:amino acid deaminase n=1 Tax=Rathayibacter soli TaxID=3144168 RepID=UPI0027E3E76F|nr:amino acid deaminase [Glaciibacter superstes]
MSADPKSAALATAALTSTSARHALPLSPRFKSFPARSWGSDVASFLAKAPTLSEFQTPLLTLEAPALAHNTSIMFDWLRKNELQLAPHGKTTMAPVLWRQLLDAGAWGMTFATAWQVQVARSFSIERIMLANALVDPVALRWVALELETHPEFEFTCWVDSVDTVNRMLAARPVGQRKIAVIIELGGPNGRTGARTVAEGVQIAEAVRNSDLLEVAGVGGYEGALAHDRSAAGLTHVDNYLDELAVLHTTLKDAGHYGNRTPIITAGGSAYFDRVADRLGPLRDGATIVLRSGAFQIHDDGFYSGITPMGTLVGNEPFRAGMHAWVRVVSRPEPLLALFDAGKRDVPYDEGMPIAQRVLGLDAATSNAVLAGSRVSALNDQHGFLRLAEFAQTDALHVGSVIRLGLSHPCTAFDKWRLVPVIDDAESDDPRIIDAVETYF